MKLTYNPQRIMLMMANGIEIQGYKGQIAIQGGEKGPRATLVLRDCKGSVDIDLTEALNKAAAILAKHEGELD